MNSNIMPPTGDVSHGAIFAQVAVIGNSLEHLTELIQERKREDAAYRELIRKENADRDKRIGLVEVRAALLVGGIAVGSFLFQYVIGPPRERVETRYITMPTPAQQAQQRPPRP